MLVRDRLDSVQVLDYFRRCDQGMPLLVELLLAFLGGGRFLIALPLMLRQADRHATSVDHSSVRRIVASVWDRQGHPSREGLLTRHGVNKKETVRSERILFALYSLSGSCETISMCTCFIRVRVDLVSQINADRNEMRAHRRKQDRSKMHTRM